MNKDAFGDRMKEYESCGEKTLPMNMPIIIRIDGNSFSKLTSRLNLKKPFDDNFQKAMESSMKDVLEYTGAKIAYCQSDEITLLVMNNLSEKFLQNRVSKICSLTASVASNAFNKFFLNLSGEFVGATFDCRVFVVPEKEVNNVFLWRQKDAWKNSVYTYVYYELQKQKGYTAGKATSLLKGLTLEEKQELIFKELHFNINNLETKYKRGFCCSRGKIKVPVSELSEESQKRLAGKEFIERSRTLVDYEIPLFSKEHDYIEKYLK